jgi:hypothetical protein
MAFMTAAALALSVGTMGYGLYQQQQGREQAEEGYALQQQGSIQQAQAAQAQAQISRDQAANSVVFAGQERDLNRSAADQSLAFSSRARDINSQITAFETQVEGKRQEAMNLDARRRSMEVIRNQQRYRAMALTNATAQGARQGSGLQGGYGQISGQSGVNLMGVLQNQMIGNDIFGLNSQITGQKQNFADLQYNYQVQQANNQTLKSNMLYDYAVANAGFQTRQANAGTMMSQGQGLVNQGSGYVSQGGMQSSMGNSLFNAGPQIFSMGMNASRVLPSVGGMFGQSNSMSPQSYANFAFGNGGLY